MGPFILKRSFHGLISLAGLIILVFFLARLTGNPADLYLPIDATEEARNRFIEAHGLDDPMYIQFFRFLLGITHLDFGESVRLGQPALDIVLRALPTTLMLGVWAMGFALAIGIPAGVIAARWPGSIVDRIASTLSLLAASLPSFWVAIVGIIVFSVMLRLLPTSGTGAPIYWIMPVMVLTFRPCGLIIQVTRGAMITALSSEYVKTAKTKGAGSTRIAMVHALRNAMLPIITVAGDEAAGIVNGAVIAETIFGFSGVGSLLIESIYARDFAAIQATVFVTAVVIFMMNLLIDIAYALLDPRIRYS